MSRRRISPTEWLIEDPATPHRSPGSYTVPAENVGSMRPILTTGGNYTGQTGYRQKALSITGKPR